MEVSYICGITGIIGDMSAGGGVHKKKDLVLDMIYTGSLRGWDSTGIATIPKDDKEAVEVYKKALSGADFICKKKTIHMLERLYSANAIIAHNRSATRGSPTDNNAHPFTHGPITLVHNGTINNMHTLVTNFRGQVDSDAICMALAQSNDAIETLGKIDGGFSLVWHDKRDNSINFARNKERPMWWLFSRKREFLVYGSEYEQLWWLTGRHGIEMEDKVFFTEPMQFYKIKDASKPGVFDKAPFFELRRHIPTQLVRAGAGVGTRHIWAETANSALGNGDLLTIESRLIKHIDKDRAKDLARIAKVRTVPLNHAIGVVPSGWQPYHGNPQGRGKIVCKYHSAHVADVDVILHSYTKEQYRALITGTEHTSTYHGSTKIIVDIINFEGVLKEPYKASFIGKVIEVKHTPIPVANHPKIEPEVASAIAVLESRKKELEEHEASQRQEGFDNLLDVVGPNRVMISKKRFVEITRTGCANCCERPNVEEAGDLVWLETQMQGDFLCKQCAALDTTLGLYTEFMSKH